MATNIEIKARAGDWPRQLRAARKLKGRRQTLRQEDTFFKMPSGRLKLREFGKLPAQLIFYDRPDQSGPKLSTYSIAPVRRPRELKRILGGALGVTGRVKKMRTVFLVGQSRIHFDDVLGLGRFIEIEVVLKPRQTATAGRRVARDLMTRLDIRDGDLIEGAYADLLSHGSAPSPR